MYKDLLVCNIDPNHMWVTLAVRQPETDENISLSPELLMDFLKEKGVKVGINRTALEALSFYVQYNKEIVVASGKYPVSGEDGHYKYEVTLEDIKAKPVVASDGTVDYLNSLKISMVTEGQVFATYIPPTQGEYGYTVFSEMIKPTPGKHIPMIKGKGFAQSEDGREYIAKLSGRIYTENDKIVIEPIYVVKGDLGIEHGNIRFNGDVQVNGDVHSGISIETDGSIFISGHVANCKLKAGKTITIGKGIQGKYGCEITAGSDVAAKFVERCNIVSQGNVYADSLMDCRVFAKDSIYVTSKQGCIIGGSINAMQLVEVRNLGNDAGIITKISIGPMEKYRKELQSYKERMQKVEKDIELLETKHKEYDQMGNSANAKEIEELKMQIMRAKVLRQSEAKELHQKVKQLDEELKRARFESKVKVNGAVYPGVVIFSSDVNCVVQESYREVIFRPWLNQIQMLSPQEYDNVMKEMIQS